MNYGKYKKSRNAAWQCLIDNNIISLPVKVTEIAKNADITVLKYSNVNPNRLNAGESGATYFINDDIFIVYRDSEPAQRCRFTIAHELGHIFLAHDLVGDKYTRKFDIEKPQIEREADIFASRLLAPACVLHELQIVNANDIAAVCDISFESATYRAERMQELERRNAWYMHPLEKQLYKQFENFINNKKAE